MNIGKVANNFFLVEDVVTVLLHEEEDLLKATAPALKLQLKKRLSRTFQFRSNSSVSMVTSKLMGYSTSCLYNMKHVERESPRPLLLLVLILIP